MINAADSSTNAKTMGSEYIPLRPYQISTTGTSGSTILGNVIGGAASLLVGAAVGAGIWRVMNNAENRKDAAIFYLGRGWHMKRKVRLRRR